MNLFNSVVLFLVFAISATVSAQVDSSFCSAPDSIESVYRIDADRLTLRRVFRNNMSYVDSAVIPSGISDTVHNALLAVYNASSLAARDTVVAMLQIHSLAYTPALRDFVITPSLPSDVATWLLAYQTGLPIGLPVLDSLIAEYGIDIGGNLTCRTDTNYNLGPIVETLEGCPEIYVVEPYATVGSGADITDSIYSDHVELTYKYGWPWCGLISCPYERFWRFKVYYDCTVEYVGSWGDYLTWSNTYVEEDQQATIQLYPNPFTNSLFIEGVECNAHYTLFNAAGQAVAVGVLKENNALGFDNLAPGHYSMLIQDSQGVYRKAVVKE